MSDKVKDIDIKNRKYYFFSNIFNIENLHLNNVKMDEKSYKSILIYYIGYVAIKEYVTTYSLNLLYLIFRNGNRYFQEINKSKYFTY